MSNIDQDHDNDHHDESNTDGSTTRVLVRDSEEHDRRLTRINACDCGVRKRLLKQLSMCDTPRDAAWERRRRQMLRQERRSDEVDLTDEDLSELKGCIELGFGFNEEDGQALCETLPALDLYFAVNRQLSLSPVSTPRSARASTSSLSSSSSSIGRSSPLGSPRADPETWKICNPGDDPQQVKTKLRHWAQAVACSVMQSY